MTVMATMSVHKLLCITVNTEIWDALDLIILRAVSSHPLAYMSTSTCSETSTTTAVTG